MEGKGVSFVERRKGGGEGICKGTAKKGVYPAVKITTNGAGVLCREEGWEEEDGARYRYLNEWTVKNNYPLPLILDILENIGMKKLFTKMNLRWGYNNVRIKEGDEWKAAFTTPERLFEPIVMFFGLTNSPVTFQAMMNELLRDLINMGKVAVFIDDVIVGTEMEEGHDELVAEVVKRLEENNLYVKPEKCK